MAALGTYIDKRTHPAIAGNAVSTFAHGLTATPDIVFAVGAVTTGSSVSAYMINALFDATNVTLQNSGEGISPVLNVFSIVAHSIIR